MSGRAWVVVGAVVTMLASAAGPAQGRLLRIFDDPQAAGGDGFASTVQSVLLVDGMMAVGAPLATAGGDAGAGVVYLFNTSGVLVRTLQSLNPAVNGHFGAGLAVVGTDLLVAAPGDSSDGIDNVGQVYRFELTGFTQVQRYRPPQLKSGIAFGTTMLVDSGTLYVAAATSVFSSTTGAGVVHAIDLATGNQIRSFEPPSDVQDGAFGTAMVVSDGNLVVGAPGTTAGGLAGAGTVSFLDPTVTGARPIRTIQSTNPTAGGAYGAALAVTDAALLIGAPGNADLGGPPSGLFYVIDPATGVTRRSIGQLGLNAQAGFGASIVLSGGNLWVAAPGANDTTGTSIGRSGGNLRLAPEVVANSTSAGVGEVFQLDPTTFVNERTLFSPSPTAGAAFATAISASGTQLLVGEPRIDSGGRPELYLFDTAPAGGPGGNTGGGTTTTSTTSTLPGNCAVAPTFPSAQCQLDALATTVTADALGPLGTRLQALLTRATTQVQSAQSAATPRRARRALRVALAAVRRFQHRVVGGKLPFAQSSVLGLLSKGTEDVLLQILATS